MHEPLFPSNANSLSRFKAEIDHLEGVLEDSRIDREREEGLRLREIRTSLIKRHIYIYIYTPFVRDR